MCSVTLCLCLVLYVIGMELGHISGLGRGDINIHCNTWDQKCNLFYGFVLEVNTNAYSVAESQIHITHLV